MTEQGHREKKTHRESSGEVPCGNIPRQFLCTFAWKTSVTAKLFQPNRIGHMQVSAIRKQQNRWSLCEWVFASFGQSSATDCVAVVISHIRHYFILPCILCFVLRKWIHTIHICMYIMWKVEVSFMLLRYCIRHAVTKTENHFLSWQLLMSDVLVCRAKFVPKSIDLCTIEWRWFCWLFGQVWSFIVLKQTINLGCAAKLTEMWRRQTCEDDKQCDGNMNILGWCARYTNITTTTTTDNVHKKSFAIRTPTRAAHVSGEKKPSHRIKKFLWAYQIFNWLRAWSAFRPVRRAIEGETVGLRGNGKIESNFMFIFGWLWVVEMVFIVIVIWCGMSCERRRLSSGTEKKKRRLWDITEYSME